MRTKAGFLGILIAISAIAAIVGIVMISGSGDESPGDSKAANPLLEVTQPLASNAPSPATPAATVPAQVYSLYTTQNLPAVGSGGGTTGGGGTGGASGGVGGAGMSGVMGANSSSSQIIDRKIERTSTLAITVDNVLDAVNQIQAAATGVGGYVSQQNVTETAGPEDDEGKPTKRQTATVQIRVPSEAYDNVMRGLRGIAKEVTSEQSQTVEVTAQYTDLQSQLRNLQATEQQYLVLLDRAETIENILTVSDRLASVRLQIEQVQGQINLLENLTGLATITINVTLPPIEVQQVVQETPKEPNFARQALDDAWEASEDVLEYMVVAAITAGVVMAWVLVPGAAILLAWRLFARKRGAGPAAS
jgi:conjugal transfer/entry exclusion protein